MSIDTVLGVDCSVREDCHWGSQDWHADTGLRLFAVKPIGPGDTALNFYRSLVSNDSGLLSQEPKWYWQSVMHVTMDGLNLYVRKLPKKLQTDM